MEVVCTFLCEMEIKHHYLKYLNERTTYDSITVIRKFSSVLTNELRPDSLQSRLSFFSLYHKILSEISSQNEQTTSGFNMNQIYFVSRELCRETRERLERDKREMKLWLMAYYRLMR